MACLINNGRRWPLAGLRAFTLIELLVVLAIVALLLTVAMPRYFGSLQHAKEVTLRENLQVMRRCLDAFQADKGRYPNVLSELVDARYLRELPVDPFTESNLTWKFSVERLGNVGLPNVTSGASGVDGAGNLYASY